MVIQDGAVAAFDTPDNLLASGGFYRDALEASGVH
jgi:ABC-type multidrug transport system fused ATPase/permease subunit